MSGERILIDRPGLWFGHGPSAELGRVVVTDDRFVWRPAVSLMARTLPFLIPREIVIQRANVQEIRRRSILYSIARSLGLLQTIQIEVAGGKVFKFQTTEPAFWVRQLERWRSGDFSQGTADLNNR
jgi:hypothetical protein